MVSIFLIFFLFSIRIHYCSNDNGDKTFLNGFEFSFEDNLNTTDTLSEFTSGFELTNFDEEDNISLQEAVEFLIETGFPTDDTEDETNSANAAVSDISVEDASKKDLTEEVNQKIQEAFNRTYLPYGKFSFLQYDITNWPLNISKFKSQWSIPECLQIMSVLNDFKFVHRESLLTTEHEIGISNHPEIEYPYDGSMSKKATNSLLLQRYREETGFDSATSIDWRRLNRIKIPSKYDPIKINSKAMALTKFHKNPEIIDNIHFFPREDEKRLAFMARKESPKVIKSETIPDKLLLNYCQKSESNIFFLRRTGLKIKLPSLNELSSEMPQFKKLRRLPAEIEKKKAKKREEAVESMLNVLRTA